MFYPDETVRLLRDIPENALAQGKECSVMRTVNNQTDSGTAIEIKWYAGTGAQTAIVPAEAVEPVLTTATEQRTAVFWGVKKPPEQLLEEAMQVLVDHGFSLRGGLNVARLDFVRQDRWWKRGEPIAFPSHTSITTAVSSWDGCVAGFSGQELFHLEFRLKGRGEAVFMLHERDAAYAEQISRTESAMNLFRVLLTLYIASAAQYCAFPVADPWLIDEDWNSLLRGPYYPDLFMLPREAVLPGLLEAFRSGRLMDSHTVLSAMPVKFGPHDDAVRETSERDLKLNSLRKCKALGEKYYDQMYETRFGPTGRYSDAKDAFVDAIATANQLGLKEEVQALEERLQHVKSVFRGQFS